MRGSVYLNITEIIHKHVHTIYIFIIYNILYCHNIKNIEFSLVKRRGLVFMKTVSLNSRPKDVIDLDSDEFKRWLDDNGKEYTLTENDIHYLMNPAPYRLPSSIIGWVIFVIIWLLSITLTYFLMCLMEKDFVYKVLVVLACVFFPLFFIVVAKRENEKRIVDLREGNFSARIFYVREKARFYSSWDEHTWHYIRCGEYYVDVGYVHWKRINGRVLAVFFTNSKSIIVPYPVQTSRPMFSFRPKPCRRVVDERCG